MNVSIEDLSICIKWRPIPFSQHHCNNTEVKLACLDSVTCFPQEVYFVIEFVEGGSVATVDSTGKLDKKYVSVRRATQSVKKASRVKRWARALVCIQYALPTLMES